ncbi:hypothetical protein NQZ68_033935 [Dissostichus eleginoides]|nr:hypothetical protein NQZ68_033935 [Dissostichus eleginoides]
MITLPQSQSDLGSNRKTSGRCPPLQEQIGLLHVEPLYCPSTPLTRDEYPEGNTDYKQEVTLVSGLRYWGETKRQTLGQSRDANKEVPQTAGHLLADRR